MSKGLDKVRKSIVERHKHRRQRLHRSDLERNSANFPELEEKHGFVSDGEYVNTGQKKKQETFSPLIMKAILSTMLFFATFLLLTSHADILTKPKMWTSHVLKEDFPFARVYQWYQETFGQPLAFHPQPQGELTEQSSYALPVNGSVTETFQMNGSGIMITPKEAVPVSAMLDGVIVFAGNDRETSKTIIIQHADQSKTTYALLSSIDVHLYQFIAAGEQIGTFNPSDTDETVFFSIEKDHQFVDPIQVINVDDIP